MRVLIVHNRYQQPGGEDVMADAEAAVLRANGHAVERLTVDNDDLGELTPLRRAGRAIWSRSGGGLVTEAAGRFGPDVIHVHNTLARLSPTAIRAAVDTPAAVVMSLHNYRLICPKGTLWRGGRRCHNCVGDPAAMAGVRHGCYRDSRAATATVAAAMLTHRLAGTWRGVDAFCVHTDHARRLFERGGLPINRLHVKGNFLADDPTPAAEPGRGAVFVGRLAEEKGVRLVLDVARRTDQPVTIIGDGPMMDDVKAAALPNVTICGQLDRPAVLDAMRAAAVVLVPSLWDEGHPLTVHEAQAVARPVAAVAHPDGGAMHDLVTHDVDGVLVPTDGYAAAAVDLLNDLGRLDRLGAAARSTFDTRATSERGHARLIEIYGRAAASRRQRVSTFSRATASS